MLPNQKDQLEARARIQRITDVFLSALTDPALQSDDLEHAAFCAMTFGAANAVERTIADIDPKYVDLKRDILVSFAYYALSKLVKQSRRFNSVGRVPPL